jgi:KipI family sensor histidine kinase inhibitor
MSIGYPKVVIASENSTIVYFSERPCSQTSDQIAYTANALKIRLGEELIDLIPSYHSLLVIYDPLKIGFQKIEQEIRNTIGQWTSNNQSQQSRTVELPVYYSPESGPDLQRIADHSGLSIDQVIELHQQTEYTVYTMGFAPGFAYLGEVDERIAMPRLATPRHNVPQGAVAIADRQTAIYPSQSPGGWNIVGLCPIRLFNAEKQPHTPMQVGDKIRFISIDRDEFIQLGGSDKKLTGAIT